MKELSKINKLIFVCLLIVFGFTSTTTAQNFPPLSVVIHDSAATQGYYFIIPYTSTAPYIYDHPQLILDKFGRMIFYRFSRAGANPNTTIDFKLQPNGLMSYFDINRGRYYLMDSSFMVVDSISCTNGFVTDQHDMQVLLDGNYLLFGTETRIMNLTSYAWFGFNHTLPGSANAEVLGVVIQEFNQNKELIWEWKSHDHYSFADVNPVWLFSPSKVDWTHANAVEKDMDGNVLISLRHFNEITKIDYSTGNILWRLGGKQNQFTFLNDPLRFTGQHDVRRVSDTSISLYDNGQYTNPPMSRGLEYALDETNKTANLVWEYIYDSSMSSIACGNHQYIENTNHLVDFGYVSAGFPWMVVVKPDKSKVMEMFFPNNYISYRAFNYPTLPWQLNRPTINCEQIGDSYYLVAEPGYSEYRWTNGGTTQSIPITEPGSYGVFVPYGSGFLCSEFIEVSDISNPCLYLSEPDHNLPKEFSFTCFPNPATNQINVKISLPSKTKLQICLYNMMGTEVLKPLERLYAYGEHGLSMDISALKPGIYYLVLTADNTRNVKKLIIQ